MITSSLVEKLSKPQVKLLKVRVHNLKSLIIHYNLRQIVFAMRVCDYKPIHVCACSSPQRVADGLGRRGGVHHAHEAREPNPVSLHHSCKLGYSAFPIGRRHVMSKLLN